MGKIVDKRTRIPIGELLLLLQSGYSVSYDSGGLVTMFGKFMTKHQVAMTHVRCKGGRFVVRETAANNRPERAKEGKTDDY